MSNKKKVEPEKPVEIEKKENILVKDLDTLKKSLKINKLNPLEKVMATNLVCDGYEFYIQHRVDLDDGELCNGRKYFILDFYIPDLKVVIETDGKIHQDLEIVTKDRYRNNFLTGKGFRVFHFSWEDVMGNVEGYDPLGHISELISYIEEEKDNHWEEINKEMKDLDDFFKKQSSIKENNAQNND